MFRISTGRDVHRCARVDVVHRILNRRIGIITKAGGRTDPVGVGPERDTRPSRVYIRDRGLEYLLGAPGVGTLLATCAPLACARVNAAVRVMPEPETCAPAGCADFNGATTVIVGLPPPLPPPVVEATTAVSWFAPLSMVMVLPALKPAPLATGITVAPTLVAVPTVVAPAVPTVAMTAVSRLAPVSIIIVWPAPKSATLATLILFAPAAEAASPVLTPSAFDGWPVPPLRRIRPVGLELTGFVETIVLAPGPSTLSPGSRLILNRLMATDNRFSLATGQREPARVCVSQVIRPEISRETSE